MAEDAKTYVFGNSDSQMAPLMAAMNNGGFGGNNAWWVVILLAALWGGNGFGGRGGCGTEAIMSALNNDSGRDMLLQAINGNGTAIGQLASTLNCDVQQLQCALSAISTGIQQVGSQVGMSGLQVQNAITSGDAALASKLQECCCENRLLTTQQGYENRIALADQTATLGSKIDQQSQMITAQFCALKEREMQSKIDSLIEANSTLKSQIDNAQQTAAITGYVNSLIAPLTATVNEIKLATPPTVAVPYPQLSAVPTSYLCGYGYPYINQSIWS